jgi:putative ATP-dependent endonuclease of the OLD family
MIIRCVEVKNFRAIRDCKIDCDNLTAILGRNGAGKSSFLFAIDIFYNIAALITIEDFFGRDIKLIIEIRVTYGSLREEEKREFSTYIRNEELIVTKRIFWENTKFVQRYYAAAEQIPQFATIRALPGKKERTSAWNELVGSNLLGGLAGKPKNADDVEQFMIQYESTHPELMQATEREEQFFGPKNIGGGKLDKFTKYVLVPAVREATDEAAGKRGAFYQILDMIVIRQVQSREDIKKFKFEYDEKIKSIYCTDNLTELPKLGISISATLEKFAPGSKLNLKWDDIKPPEIQLPPAVAKLVEDDFEGEISRKGHGLQRALILTLLQHLAMTVPTDDKSPSSDGSETNISIKQAVPAPEGPDLILAIEEPELYLHPSRCRYLAELLLKITTDPSLGLGAQNQILYTTHSPYFVDLDRFDQIRKVRKLPSPDPNARQCIVTRFSLEEATRESEKVYGAKCGSFTTAAFKAHSKPVMNNIVNEGFFADVVVVVEGLSDIGVLWKLQEIMKKNWSQLGIVIVPAIGKNNIDRPVIVFRGFSIPTYFIFDGDCHLRGGKGKEKEAIARNHRYLRLAGEYTEDFPNTQVKDKFAVFEDTLESVIKAAVDPSKYPTLCEKTSMELGYESADRIFKNIEGSSRFIEYAYDEGQRIPVLEEIIIRVSNLHECI